MNKKNMILIIITILCISIECIINVIPIKKIKLIYNGMEYIVQKDDEICGMRFMNIGRKKISVIKEEKLVDYEYDTLYEHPYEYRRRCDCIR